MHRALERIPRVGVLLAAVVMLALGAGGGSSTGSGSSDAAASSAQPALSGDFVPNALADLPTPGGAELLGPATVQGDAWTESFEVVGLGSAETMQFYASSLTSPWTQTTPIAALGNCNSPALSGTGCTYRVVWNRSALQLEVTAGPDVQVVSDGGDSGNATQLNLVLTGTK